MNKIASLICLMVFISMNLLSAQENLNKEQILAVNKEINDYRSSRGLPQMRLLIGLCEIAQEHADDMASKRIDFSHEGFDDRVAQIKRRYDIQYCSTAENLFYTSLSKDVAGQTLEGWVESPGHHKNLKGNYKYTGIGIALSREGWFYVVQIYLNK